MEKTKICTSCGIDKVLSCFNNRKLSKDGKRYECRGCHNIVSKKWQKINPDKRRLHNQKWGKANRPKCRANWAKYYYAKMQRTPKWLTKYHHKQIEMFYEAAHRLTIETGIQFEVDHIMPLQGRLCSGLHVPWNLQVLTGHDKASKSNKVWLNGEE